MKLLKQVLWTLRIRGYWMLWQWTVNRECWLISYCNFRKPLHGLWSINLKLVFRFDIWNTGTSNRLQIWFCKENSEVGRKVKIFFRLIFIKVPRAYASKNSNKGTHCPCLLPSCLCNLPSTFQGDLPKSLPWWLWDGTEPMPLCNQSQCSRQAHHFTSAQRSSSRFPEWNSRVGLVQCPQEKGLPYGYQPAAFIPSLQHNFKDVWSLQAWDLWNTFYNWDWLVLVCFERAGVAKGSLRVGHKTNIFGRKIPLWACCR